MDTIDRGQWMSQSATDYWLKKDNITTVNKKKWLMLKSCGVRKVGKEFVDRQQAQHRSFRDPCQDTLTEKTATDGMHLLFAVW